MPSGVFKRSVEHRRKIGLATASRRGERASGYRTGTTRRGRYHLTLKPNHRFRDKNGYVFTHRLVYDDSHNCCLLPWVDIHHKDENPLNNNWYNLQPMMRGDHGRQHNTKYSDDHRCVQCGSSRTFIRRDGTKEWSNGMCHKCQNRINARKRRMKKKLLTDLHSS